MPVSATPSRTRFAAAVAIAPSTNNTKVRYFFRDNAVLCGQALTNCGVFVVYSLCTMRIS